MRTTVIGSYPARPSPEALERGYRDADAPDPYLESLGEAVGAQLDAGVELVSDGQTRNDMVGLFVTKLAGTRLHGVPRIIGDIEFRGPITVEDQRRVREMLPPGRGVKGIITGPYTLAKSCRDERYGSLQEATMAFARAMNQEARVLAEVVDTVQVDEPFFSLDYPEYGREAVEAVLAGVERETALHVCGDVSGIFERLADFDVDVLEHEFAANPALLDVVSQVSFKQKLGYGSVRSDKGDVESVEQIAGHIRNALKCFGPERLLISPDCGLRHQPPEAAFGKLANMVKARDLVMADV